MSAENLSGAQDRFAGQVSYRARRDTDPVEPGSELSPRNGAEIPPRPSLADLDALAEPMFGELASQTGQLRGELAGQTGQLRGELASPTGQLRGELATKAGAWPDGPSGTLADHPLLRGLLLELPPKGTTPAPGWLDRWFEAARSILELLYVQEGQRR